MNMTDAQFLRIETLAGGCACGNRAFIRAARTRLSVEGKSRQSREKRHAWIRSGLAKRRKSKSMGL